MLQCIQGTNNLGTTEMRWEINDLLAQTIEELQARNIAYADLKPALVPSKKKFEAAFLFDSTRVDSAWYGPPIFHAFMPLLNRDATQSVRVGDLIGNGYQDLIRSIIADSLVAREPLEFAHSTNIYCIYVNNLSNAQIGHINNGLLTFPPYCGYIPTTLKPRARIFLSTTLMSFFLKCRKTVIMPQPIDYAGDSGEYQDIYAFQQNGYTQIGVRDDCFETFLSYKLERPTLPGQTFDTEMAITSVSDSYIPIELCTLHIDELKFLRYLRTEKLGSLKRAGLDQITLDELRSIIFDKITANYIYNLAYNPEHDIIKFNVLLEFPYNERSVGARLIAAFEYQPEKQAIRLLTLY